LVLMAAALQARAQFGDGFGGGGGFGKATPCPAYSCSSGAVALPKVGFRVSSPGCGGMGMNIMSMDSHTRKPGDDQLKSCCDIRHACFAVCGSSRVNCEAAFGKCTKKACAFLPEGGEAKKGCDQAANMHTLTANLGGCKPFEEAQAANCQCVVEKKAERHRARVISAFYKKHNKEKNSDKKSKELAKKHSSTSKFSKLMMKMIKKYPKSIKKVQDPQQKMYEDMMQRAKDAPPPSPPAEETASEGGEEEDEVEEEAEEAAEEAEEVVEDGGAEAPKHNPPADGADEESEMDKPPATAETTPEDCKSSDAPAFNDKASADPSGDEPLPDANPPPPSPKKKKAKTKTTTKKKAPEPEPEPEPEPAEDAEYDENGDVVEEVEEEEEE